MQQTDNCQRKHRLGGDEAEEQTKIVMTQQKEQMNTTQKKQTEMVQQCVVEWISFAARKNCLEEDAQSADVDIGAEHGKERERECKNQSGRASHKKDNARLQVCWWQ